MTEDRTEKPASEEAVSHTARREEETARFWNERSIFEKSLSQRAGAEPFVFYDGPPFATGRPHYGHILASIIKDVIPRYQTMRGKLVPRRWGWDCHGLPLENIIEKELGLAHKKDIEAYGIAKFNKAAEEAVLRYAGDWKRVIPRIGRWVDMERDYRTMDSAYTESVWWVFKTLHNKKRIYEGYKAMHLCPRCETTLANFEVSQGYKDIADLSVTAKFELTDKPGTFVLAWTTTPWTLPGNAALAINSSVVYAKCKMQNAKTAEEYYIAAKDRLSDIFADNAYEIVEEFSGEKLMGLSYKPPFDYYSSDKNLENRENGWKIYAADFVTTQEGTGVVHIAPAFGEDDMRIGKEHNLPFIQHVLRDGTFESAVTDFAGLPVKPREGHQRTDVEIIKNLLGRGILFSKKKIAHAYPFCWRCETPLLNYAAASWFVSISDMRGILQKTAEEISWTPAHIKGGRFGKGLETAPDWAISRTRFWGAPLPVWKCRACEKQFVAGSLDDLETHRAKKPTTFILMRHGERRDLPHQKDNPELYAPIVISSDPLVGIHVTDAGKDDIRKEAEKIQQDGGVDGIISSDFIRTKETAEVASAVLGVPVSYDERLRELRHGELFEGKTVEEYRLFFSDERERFIKAPPGGETLRDVRRRMMGAICELAAAYEGKRILVISHGDPLWVLEGALRNMPEEELVEARKNYIKQGEARTAVLKNYPYDGEGRLNMHRPYIDEIQLQCVCGGKMKRIPEVFDCWFESGSMPYAERRYMGTATEDFDPTTKKGLPADFIAEGLDQTRGWFYSLHVLAGGLFELPAYKNVVVNGIILAEDGQKMSKRLKNYPDPMDVVALYGADALRLYLLSSSAVYAEDLNFLEKGVDEMHKKVILRLSNVLSFYLQYAAETGAEPVFAKDTHALDKFILYELHTAQQIIEHALDTYELHRAARAAAAFVDVLSTIYLQYSRDRFKKEADNHERARAVFRYVLVRFSKLCAPLMPFLAEELYLRTGGQGAGEESVHLADWPALDPQTPSFAHAHGDVRNAHGTIAAILFRRSAEQIPVRQPLAQAKVRELPNDEEIRAIIRERVNVEVLEEDASLPADPGVWIDTVITPALREQGMVREVIRGVQDARKKEGLQPNDRVVLRIYRGNIPDTFFETHRHEILRAVGAESMAYSAEKETHAIDVGGAPVAVSFDV